MANGHGGARKGSGSKAGKPKGAKQIATQEEREALAVLCRSYVKDMVDNAVSIMRRGDSDAARMSAINWLADRGFGKAVQAVEHSGKDGDAIEVNHQFGLLTSLLNDKKPKGD